jgi:hypothetical protein
MVFQYITYGHEDADLSAAALENDLEWNGFSAGVHRKSPPAVVLISESDRRICPTNCLSNMVGWPLPTTPDRLRGGMSRNPCRWAGRRRVRHGLRPAFPGSLRAISLLGSADILAARTFECGYVVVYDAARDPGGDTRYVNPADAPLVQAPGTGAVFKICPSP